MTCVYGSVEFAVAGETVMMMHEMIVMVVVAGGRRIEMVFCLRC